MCVRRGHACSGQGMCVCLGGWCGHAPSVFTCSLALLYSQGLRDHTGLESCSSPPSPPPRCCRVGPLASQLWNQGPWAWEWSHYHIEYFSHWDSECWGGKRGAGGQWCPPSHVARPAVRGEGAARQGGGWMARSGRFLDSFWTLQLHSIYPYVNSFAPNVSEGLSSTFAGNVLVEKM